MERCILTRCHCLLRRDGVGHLGHSSKRALIITSQPPAGRITLTCCSNYRWEQAWLYCGRAIGQVIYKGIDGPPPPPPPGELPRTLPCHEYMLNVAILCRFLRLKIIKWNSSRFRCLSYIHFPLGLHCMIITVCCVSNQALSQGSLRNGFLGGIVT